MTYDPDRHHRRSVRLKGYDYAQPGAYFITIVTHDRASLFGDVVDGRMRLNDAGRMVVTVCDGLRDRFPGLDLDGFVVMPNHIHGIIVLPDGATAVHRGATATDHGATTNDDRATTNQHGATLVGAPDPLVGAPSAPSPPTGPVTLGAVVGAFKSITTVEYTRGVDASGWPPFRGRLWQRNYYEHVIRDDDSLERTRQYIFANPADWPAGLENPFVLMETP